MRAVPVLVAAALVATAHADPSDAPPPRDGPGAYIGVSFRLGRTEDANETRTLSVIGLSTGARYRYRCLEAGLGLTLDWMKIEHATGHVLGGEGYVLRDVSPSWAIGGRISAGRGEADGATVVGDGFVGMAGVRARYRGLLAVSFDGYLVRGGDDEHAEGLLVGASATGDVFKYGYATGVVGLVLAGGIMVLASHYGWFEPMR